MKLGVCLLMFLMLVGCTSKQPSSSKIDVPEKESVELPSGDKLEIQVWEEGMELDSGDTESPSFSEKLSDILKDDSSFHFRKVRWGFPQKRVELAEVGNTVHQRTDNALVYKTKINGVYCDLIYTFKDNRLRTAGYLVKGPVPNAHDLVLHAVDKYGKPDNYTAYCGLEDLVWHRPDVVIYSNLSITSIKFTRTKYRRSPGGLFKNLLRKKPERITLSDLLRKDPRKQKAVGIIVHYDGTYAHVDPAFFNLLHEENYPEDELSFYEKRLTGTILPSIKIR